MEARLVDRKTYEKTTYNIKNIFNTAAFAELNRDKVDEIVYIIIYKGDSPRFSVIFGRVGKSWKCPFSAPFGYIEPLRKNQSVENYEKALDAIETFAEKEGCLSIFVTLPPFFYDFDTINTWYTIMVNSGWENKYVDMNFSINISPLEEDYDRRLYRNARKNYNIAQKAHLTLRRCATTAERKKAYSIIESNRQSKGYPLRMSEKQVFDTINIVSADMFIVSDNDVDIASALVYEVTSEVAQVIYWGNLLGSENKKPMNYLSHELVEIYAKRGYKYLDIGPSTECGKPNYGLCEFKDGIGCDRVIKPSVYKEIKKQL